MARERISLVPEEVKEKKTIESMIRSGEIGPHNYKDLTPEQQDEVNRVLFKIAESQINISQGVSTVEFILFAFIRIMNKKVKGLALSAEDRKLEEKLQAILNLHEITNESLSMNNWLFDYMGYAYHASDIILNNRKEHVHRKRNVTGNV